MPSSQNTIENTTCEQLYAAMALRGKRISARMIKDKLASGEYVMYQGKVAPMYVIEEAMAEKNKKTDSLSFEQKRAV